MQKPSPRLAPTLRSISASAVLSLTVGLGLALPFHNHVRAAEPNAGVAKPTVVLVHGAFAGSSSWNGVISRLTAKGFPVIAVANPLRSVRTDASYVATVVDTIHGNVVLVGHSYGGNVITSAGAGKANVKALVYVAGVAPDVGESADSLVGKFPGSTLGPTLAPPTFLSDGTKDLYIEQSKYHAQFAADVSASAASLMAVTQRPVTESALKEPTEGAVAWRAMPSWFIFGSRDKNIPPAVHAFMAKRAGAKRTQEVSGASHVVMTSHPDAVAKMIEEAAVAQAN